MDSEDDSDLSWIGMYVLDDDGNPMPERDVLAWGQWFDSHSNRVALTEFRWGGVSTIFLGLDHSFNFFAMDDPLNYKPVLWETMIFGGPLDQSQRRYTSKEEALEGHRQMVEECMAGQEDLLDRIYLESILR
jgi:hypothetical protein